MNIDMASVVAKPTHKCPQGEGTRLESFPVPDKKRNWGDSFVCDPASCVTV
jgi:hypothetical protein